MTEKMSVLWDMDGVLVDTGDFHYQAWKSALSEYGILLSYEKFQSIFGMNNRSILQLFYGEKFTEQLYEEIGNLKETYFRSAIKGHIRLLPGVLPLLKSIQQRKIPQAIASSAPQANIDAILSELALASYFQAIVSASEMPGKPDPTVFLNAAELLECPPDRCIVVEDAPAGVEAARRAGMKCVAVTTTHQSDVLKYADLILDRLDEISVNDLIKLVK